MSDAYGYRGKVREVDIGCWEWWVVHREPGAPNGSHGPFDMRYGSLGDSSLDGYARSETQAQERADEAAREAQRRLDAYRKVRG